MCMEARLDILSACFHRPVLLLAVVQLPYWDPVTLDTAAGSGCNVAGIKQPVLTPACDPLACLLAIQHREVANVLITEIVQRVHEIISTRTVIVLCGWLPSHFGLSGNEARLKQLRRLRR